MILKILATLLIAFASLTTAMANQPSVIEKTQEAYELYSVGSYEEAVSLFEDVFRAMKKTSGNDLLGRFKITFYLGLSYRAMGDYNLSAEWFEKAFALSKQMKDKAAQATMLAYLGESARLSGDYTKAEASYNEAITNIYITSKDKTVLYHGLAETYRLQMEYDKAKDACIVAESLASDQQAEQLKLSCELIKGESYRAKGEYAMALQSFGIVLDLGRARKYPDMTIVALNGMGLTADALGRKDAARAYFEEALSLSLKNEIYNNVGVITDKLSTLIPQGKFLKQADEAASAARRLENISSYFKISLWRLAAAYYKASGDYIKSMDANQNAYLESIADTPGVETITALYEISDDMFTLKRYNSALVRLDEAVGRCKTINCDELAKIYALKAECLVAVERLNDAITTMTEAAKLDPKYTERLKIIQSLVPYSGKKEQMENNNHDVFEKTDATPVG